MKYRGAGTVTVGGKSYPVDDIDIAIEQPVTRDVLERQYLCVPTPAPETDWQTLTLDSMRRAADALRSANIPTFQSGTYMAILTPEQVRALRGERWYTPEDARRARGRAAQGVRRDGGVVRGGRGEGRESVSARKAAKGETR